VFGFTLDERFGRASFWCWLIGFYLAFTPLYVLGLQGMTRRLQHISGPELAALAAYRRGRRHRHHVRHSLSGLPQLYVSIRRASFAVI